MTDPVKVEDAPWLERVGVSYFQQLSRGVRVVDEDGVHLLNERELRALKATERGAIARAALAGALSALISAVAEVQVAGWLGAESIGLKIEGWGVVGGATVVASVLEIGYLYWDGLRSVHRLSVVAALDLFKDPHEEQQAVARALVRAALELPNPPRGLYDLDALHETSRVELMVTSLVYKLKTGISSFLLKALVRRALGRTVLRSYLQAILPFIAVPVTALWNGVVAWLVVREARLRVIGPSAARHLCGLILGGVSLSEEGKELLLRAVACSVIKTGDLHPNLVALLREVARCVGESSAISLGNSDQFLEMLARAPQAEAVLVLRLLGVAAVIDGRITRSEQAFLRRAHECRGGVMKADALKALRRRLFDGLPLETSHVEALAW